MPVDVTELLGTPRGLIGCALALAEPCALSREEASLVASVRPARAAKRLVCDVRDAIRSGGDPLGDAFCAVYTPAERRPRGATYTPAIVVEAMLDWASDGPPPERVIDPGSGSGRFSVAAGRRFPGATIVAIEQDPLAALLTRANLSVWEATTRSRVVVGDYRVDVPASNGQSTLFIGNPPYVRHHNIEPVWKQWLTATAREMGHSASQLAGLHVHFFLATVAFGSRGDRGAFITPSEWLDVNYGALVRDLALNGLGARAIHVVTPASQLFGDAQTTAAITCFELGAKPSSVRLRSVKRAEDLGRLDGGQQVRRERLAEARRWTPFLRTARAVPEGYVELGELVRVHRGAVTGANRVWVVDPATTDLPERILTRSVTRARELIAAGLSLSDASQLRAVVDLPHDLAELAADERGPVERFLRQARSLGVHEGYVASHRSAWWSVGLRAPAPLLATYMARRVPAIVRNLAAARHINIAHGLYPRAPLSEETLSRLAQAIRDSVTVGHGRTYAGGLTKFEPRELERLLIPDVTGTA